MNKLRLSVMGKTTSEYWREDKDFKKPHSCISGAVFGSQHPMFINTYHFSSKGSDAPLLTTVGTHVHVHICAHVCTHAQTHIQLNL